MCANPDKGCDELYKGGPEGTVVRLPNSVRLSFSHFMMGHWTLQPFQCASVPFAIVNREWTHADQDIPLAKRSKMVRRQDGGVPIVKGLALSTDLGSAGTGQGNVSLLIVGSSLPGAAGNFSLTSPSQARALAKRGLFDSIKNALKSASANPRRL